MSGTTLLNYSEAANGLSVIYIYVLHQYNLGGIFLNVSKSNFLRSEKHYDLTCIDSLENNLWLQRGLVSHPKVSLIRSLTADWQWSSVHTHILSWLDMADSPVEEGFHQLCPFLLLADGMRQAGNHLWTVITQLLWHQDSSGWLMERTPNLPGFLLS